MLTAVASAPAKFPPSPSPVWDLLVIDEDRADLHAYTQILRQEGYAVRSCMSSTEAACLLETRRSDLVIISQGGPGFEWRSLLEQAMRIDSMRPVLIMADHVDMPSYGDAMWLGATDYLEKPRTPRELLSVVGRFLTFLGSCA